MNWDTLSVKRFTHDQICNGKAQSYTFYALARNGEMLMDAWSDGSTTPTWWESKPYDIQEAINKRDRELIALLNETPEQRAVRIAERERSYREFIQAIDRNVSDVAEIG